MFTEILTVAGVVVGMAAGGVQIADILRKRRRTDGLADSDDRSPIGQPTVVRDSTANPRTDPHPEYWLDRATPDVDTPPTESVADRRDGTKTDSPTFGEPDAELIEWARRLRRRLLFPFDARFLGHLAQPALVDGAIVLVRRVLEVRDGEIIADIASTEAVVEAPIQFVRPLELGSHNDELLNSYRRWRDDHEIGR